MPRGDPPAEGAPPRRRRRRHRHNAGAGGSRLRYIATVCGCIIAPMTCVGLLLFAWVLVNFRDAPEFGDCVIANLTETLRGTKCTYVPGWWQQWEAHIPGIILIPPPDESEGGNKSCTLIHSTNDNNSCYNYLRLWNSSLSNSTCWRIIERSWWFGPSHSHCYTEQPRGPDVFDRALPLICGGVIIIVAAYFWVTCCLRRNHERRRRQDRERSPLLNEEMGPESRSRGTQVTDVARIGRRDGRDAAATTTRLAGDRASAVVTVSAVWLGPTEAAVVMGDAKGGQYPCEVERVYDVSMSTEECCVVCLTEPKQVVMWPCRHMCACPDCAPRLKKCPLCRKTVTRRLRLELQPMPDADAGGGAASGEKPLHDADASAVSIAEQRRSCRSAALSWRGSRAAAAAPLPSPSPSSRSSATRSDRAETERSTPPATPRSGGSARSAPAARPRGEAGEAAELPRGATSAPLRASPLAPPPPLHPQDVSLRSLYDALPSPTGPRS